ncbi:MAG: hemerythrin family protein [Alphaproteobacteria bacterium]|nr:hemerythrin family protein [Alphaproteobacteria bacterium]
MPLMQWNERMSVGIEQFDNDHKKLVSMLNNLFDGMQAGKAKDVLGPILDDLIDYTKTHFAREEEAMARFSYQEFASHKREHDDLTRQVIDVQTKFHQDLTASLSMEVMNFLKNWLVKHIQGTDRKYTPFFHSNGVK